MSDRLAILCYHRVLPDGECLGLGQFHYLRGTAVSQSSFQSQIRALAAEFNIISELEVIAWLDGSLPSTRPCCWITFDDGYKDVLETALPILNHAGVSATMFVSTDVIEHTGHWLPADHWYATLGAARRQGGTLALAGFPAVHIDLGRDLPRLVDGPEKRAYLQASPAARRSMLATLARAFDAADLGPNRPYLDSSGLKKLIAAGWTIGGHGRTHTLLPGISHEDLDVEVRGSKSVLTDLGIPARAFAFPNGNYDVHVLEAIQAAGWNLGLTIEPSLVNRETDRRCLGRFIPSNEPDWVGLNLLPSLVT